MRIPEAEKKLHRLWIREQRKRYPNDRVEYDTPVCDICLCNGGQECGHYPFDKAMCALDESMICGCCSVESNAMSDLEYDDMNGQSDMFKEQK